MAAAPALDAADARCFFISNNLTWCYLNKWLSYIVCVSIGSFRSIHNFSHHGLKCLQVASVLEDIFNSVTPERLSRLYLGLAARPRASGWHTSTTFVVTSASYPSLCNWGYAVSRSGPSRTKTVGEVVKIRVNPREMLRNQRKWM